MNVNVDLDACIGCGLCPSIAPDLFEMRDDGKAHELSEEVPEGLEDAAMEGAESCPVDAIHTS